MRRQGVTLHQTRDATRQDFALTFSNRPTVEPEAKPSNAARDGKYTMKKVEVWVVLSC